MMLTPHSGNKHSACLQFHQGYMQNHEDMIHCAIIKSDTKISLDDPSSKHVLDKIDMTTEISKDQLSMYFTIKFLQ